MPLVFAIWLGVTRPQWRSIHLHTPTLAKPIVISPDSELPEIWAMELRGNVAAEHTGRGELVLGISRPEFNDFGDTTFDDEKTFRTKIKFRPVEIPPVRGRRVFELLTGHSSLSRRFYLVFDEQGNEEHRLLYLGNQSKPIEDLVGPLDTAPIARRMELQSASSAPASNTAHPLRERITLQSQYQVKAGYYEIVGELGGTAGITHDSNQVGLNVFGDETFTTLVGCMPYRATLRELKLDHPDKKGRRLFVVDTGGPSQTQLHLVVSPDDNGPHRLIVRQGPKVIDVLPLHDPHREKFMRNLAQNRDSISEAEAQVLDEITRRVGYQVSWESRAGHLVVLSLNNGTASDDVLAHVAKFNHLENLRLDGRSVSDEGVLQLRHLAHLKKLDLRNTLVLRSTVAQLETNSAVEVVPPSVSSVPEERDVVCSLLDAGIRLETDDDGHVISAEDAYGWVFPTVAAQEIFTNLATLRKLRSLHLAGVEIDNDDLVQVPSMSQLEYLDLGALECSDDDLAIIQELTRLKTLRIVIKGLSATGYGHLSAMKSLDTLHLGIYEATDFDLPHVAKLTSLRRLSVYGSISDSSVHHIATLGNLQSLSIVSSDISDAGLMQLSALVHLERLSIVDHRSKNVQPFTRETVERLEQKLPKTTIGIQPGMIR